MKLFLDLAAIPKHADETIRLARREEQARPLWVASYNFYSFHEEQRLGVCFFALWVACGTSDGIEAVAFPAKLARCFGLSTARGVHELLFQITALRVAPKLGWDVVPAPAVMCSGSLAAGLVTFTVRILLHFICVTLCLEFACLRNFSLLDKCSWKNLLKLSFGLGCEISQCQLLIHRRRREFCLKSCFFFLLFYMCTV